MQKLKALQRCLLRSEVISRGRGSSIKQIMRSCEWQETFTAELQVEREKNSLLQEDLAPLLYAPPMESLNIRG